MKLPHVWGDGGALFAFSGMDGQTDWLHPLVGSTLAAGRGAIFHSPGNPTLRFGLRVGDREFSGNTDAPFDLLEDEVVGSGLMISQIEANGVCIKLTYVFLENSVLGISVQCEHSVKPFEVFIECVVENAESTMQNAIFCQTVGNDCYVLACLDSERVICNNENRVYAALSQAGDCVNFAWTYSADGCEDASTRARRIVNADIENAVNAQLEYFCNITAPRTKDVSLVRAYYKAASVLKVNCCSPEGGIAIPWTTPDRWPHKHMWIWDSAFHAIGLRHISGEWAENAIMAVLSVQRYDGFIAHVMKPDLPLASDIIQPPILAWASWKVYEITRNKSFLSYVAPRIAKMIDYDCRALDSDNNGLSEWECDGASGMDNSPRFDQPIKDAIDLNSYIVNDMRWLAAILEELGDGDAAMKLEAEANQRADRINNTLWDAESGFYYDNAPNGKLLRIKTEAGFTPMFAGVCNDKQAAKLVEHLTNSYEFWRPFPVASVSADEPTFSDNMWRGPVWVNYNYLIIEGLRRYGYTQIADDLRDRTLSEIARWYSADGLLYEFYDSEAVTSPVLLHRKMHGGPMAQKGSAALGTNVCDYNWTAALFVDMHTELVEA